MKKIIKFLMLSIICLSLSNPVYAKDNENFLDKADREQLLENMESMGIVDKKVQRTLLKKLENGELLDSMNPDKIAEVDEELLTPTNEEPVKSYTFEDGSVIRNSIQKVGFGINGCGTGYCNYYEYRVRAEYVAITAQYYVDFTINQGTSVADRISRAYNESASATGVAIVSTSLTIPKATEDTTNKIKAYSNYKVVFGNLAGQKTGNLKFFVGQDTYSTKGEGF